MQSRMEIDAHGARVTKLVLSGVDILFYGTRGDGKDGVTHPCTPNFGKDPSVRNLPQHGPMRTAQCVITKKTPTHVILSYAIEHEHYPKGVRVTQEFHLENDAYTITTTHHNTGPVEAPVNFGEHFYWIAPSGWAGTLINGMDITGLVRTTGSLELLPTNTISIPDQKTIVLRQKGFTQAVLWAYYNPDTNLYDSSYVCIEPVEHPVSTFNQPESMLLPQQKRVTEIHISLAT